MPTLRSRPLRAVVFALAMVVVIGCETDNRLHDLESMNKSNIQRLSNLYAAFQNAKGGVGPKDEAEFKEFIKVYAPDYLKAMSIDPANLDKTFTSERDNKPFKIRYKVGGGRGAVAPVVFETGGQEGKKQVGFTGGKVEDVGEAEYTALWEGKSTGGNAPPSGGPPSGGPPAGGGGRPGGGRPAGAPAGPPGG